MSRYQIKKTAIALSSVVLVFFSFGSIAQADQFTDQINALSSQVGQDQQQAAALRSQADTYQGELASLQNQAAMLEAQIALTQTKYNMVTTDIATNQQNLATQKAQLAIDIQQMYLASTETPLEVLVSSSSLADFFNQQQYRDSIGDKIQSAMSSIETLQAQLQQEQVQTADLLLNQKGQQQQLDANQQQVNSLLATAQQGIAAANAAVQSNNAQISKLQAEEAASIAAASRSVHGYVPPANQSGSGGACDKGEGNGGYPAVWCNAAQDSLVDSWGMYNRECVSYAAWYASSEEGLEVPYGMGNANQWPGAARADGIPVDNNPVVGAVAIYMGGPYGHDMIVDSIQGSNVITSSMNADDEGHFEIDSWPISDLEFIHFNHN